MLESRLKAHITQVNLILHRCILLESCSLSVAYVEFLYIYILLICSLDFACYFGFELSRWYC